MNLTNDDLAEISNSPYLTSVFAESINKTSAIMSKTTVKDENTINFEFDRTQVIASRYQLAESIQWTGTALKSQTVQIGYNFEESSCVTTPV